MSQTPSPTSPPAARSTDGRQPSAGLVIAVLAAAANTPLACVFLGIELFGGSGAVLFAVACAAAYVCSGHKGLYHAQTVSAHKSGRPGGGAH